ncbi:hypothetical protein Aph01nite_33470 [Acrocarpospora phusangensis]|uniref:Carboxypeptidase regulatory-like domain-containing protein n=1 Tax=Acrocarpospora phusangensis TaxID=1070424 RepID=A0A919UNY4_9ACTN|nr:hypothetical protein [Acrocarpospora phusangensis]GIH25037.1 hypothetical protein Aph01nite_33470 [Acrocarpospora phusangensis]
MDEYTGPEEELRGAAERFDPVPLTLFDHAMYAFAVRALDAELAQLTFDSLWESSAALVRGPAGPRALTFESGAVTVEMEVSDTGTASRLVGRLLPPGPADVGVQRRDEQTTLRTDESGRFAVDLAGHGPFRLRVTPADGTSVVTAWVRL